MVPPLQDCVQAVGVVHELYTQFAGAAVGAGVAIVGAGVAVVGAGVGVGDACVVPGDGVVVALTQNWSSHMHVGTALHNASVSWERHVPVAGGAHLRFAKMHAALVHSTWSLIFEQSQVNVLHV